MSLLLSPSRPSAALRQFGLLLALILLAGVAVFLWTAPLLQERRWQAASLEQLRAAARQEPGNARVFYYLGLHWQGLGQAEAAQAAYARAVTLDPDGMAATLRALHQHPAQAAVPTHQLIRDAGALLAQDDLSGAERGFTAILARDPNSASACYSLGVIREQQGKTEEAFRAYSRAAQMDPRLYEARYRLALLYYNAGFPDEAGRRMKALVQEAPEESRYWYGLGNCVKNDPAWNQDAAADFRRAAALDPRSGECLLALAEAEAKLHQDAAAERDGRAALALRPGEAAPALALGLFLRDHAPAPSGQAEAARLLRTALALSPHNPAALTGLGQDALSRNRPQEAVGLLEDAEAHSPSDPRIWYLLGTAYERLGNARRAAYCRAAFRSLDDYARQLSFAEELARKSLGDPKIRLRLARLYAQGGQYARAINQYGMCRHLDPGNAEARKELAALTRRLTASGEMPSMSAFDGMMVASVKSEGH